MHLPGVPCERSRRFIAPHDPDTNGGRAGFLAAAQAAMAPGQPRAVRAERNGVGAVAGHDRRANLFPPGGVPKDDPAPVALVTVADRHREPGLMRVPCDSADV